MVDKGRSSDKINFKYKTEYVPNKDGDYVPVEKPKIEVVFRRFSETKTKNNKEFRTFALIDSGADYSFLPKQIAELLHLDIDESDQRIYTIAGELKVWTSQVHVEIPLRGKRPIQVGMIDLHIMPFDVEEKYLQKLIILGRKDFFDKFSITFNEHTKSIMLKDSHANPIKKTRF